MKIINGFVRNCGLKWYKHEYKGTLIEISHPNVSCISSHSLKLWRQTLPVNGGSLYNILPRELRDISGVSVNSFKNCLDKYLERIPDCPRAHPLLPDPINPTTNKNSNCLIDWIQYLGRTRDNYRGDNMF